MDTLTIEAPVTEAPTKTPQDYLRHAARIIEEFGWVQGDMGNEQKGYCVAGAIGVATKGQATFTECDFAFDGAFGLLTDYLVPWGEFGPVSWNDAPERTKEEVIAALRAAAG